MTSLLESLRLKQSQKKLMRKVREASGKDTSRVRQMEWLTNRLSVDTVKHLLDIISDDERVNNGRFVTAVETLTDISFSQFPSLAYRAIHDHYEYALAVTGNDITRTLRVIAEAFTDPHLDPAQERALIHLEASREEAEAGWNNGSFPVRRHHYSPVIRQTVLERPEHVEQIIRIAATKPDVRTIELAALLDKSTATPLTGGIL